MMFSNKPTYLLSRKESFLEWGKTIAMLAAIVVGVGGSGVAIYYVSDFVPYWIWLIGMLAGTIIIISKEGGHLD